MQVKLHGFWSLPYGQAGSQKVQPPRRQLGGEGEQEGRQKVNSWVSHFCCFSWNRRVHGFWDDHPFRTPIQLFQRIAYVPIPPNASLVSLKLNNYLKGTDISLCTFSACVQVQWEGRTGDSGSMLSDCFSQSPSVLGLLREEPQKCSLEMSCLSFTSYFFYVICDSQHWNGTPCSIQFVSL